jgi:hypothetical protein
MKSLIIIRQSENWGKISREEHIANYCKKFSHMLNDKFEKQYKDRFWTYLKNVKNWDGYLKYRSMVCEIAKATWIETGIDVVCSNDFRLIPDENLILIPTDDDDWFCPDLNQQLITIFDDPAVSIIVWRTHHLKPKSIYVESLVDRVGSNGYAIRASVATERLIQNHAAVNNVNFLRISQLGNSVWVRHSACWTKMSEQNFSFESFTMPNLKNMMWAKQYVKKLQCLNM